MGPPNFEKMPIKELFNNTINFYIFPMITNCHSGIFNCTAVFNKLTKMKRLGEAVLMIAISMAGQNAKAQNFKFGHINSDELIQVMPEFDSAKIKLEKLQKELINYLEIMSVELNTKYDAYNKDSKNLSDFVKQTKEQELSDINRRIQEFQNTAQIQLQEKQVELFQPIYLKVEKAIRDIGKENGFFYIFNTSQGDPLYFDESKSVNVSALAKAKLKMK